MSSYTIQPGDTIQFPPEQFPAMVPNDIMNFLGSRGWHIVYKDRWEHDAKGRSSMTWEQAMAVEFYEFITIGGR